MQKILVIEDEADMARGLRDILEFEDYGVTVAGTGREGLQALGRKVPDCIILDIMLPGMDGIEFLKEVRSVNPDAVRILISGRADFEMAIRVINKVGLLSVDHFLGEQARQVLSLLVK